MGKVPGSLLDPGIADWDRSKVRAWFVDYDAGSDAGIGYLDITPGAAIDPGVAAARALKTWEELEARLPMVGAGRKALVLIKSRAAGATYLKKDGVTPDNLRLEGIASYERLIARGTGTSATAGCTAFDNSTADKIHCGGQIVAGTNAAGYNPTGAPTANTFDLQLNGGGAPGLAAEPALIGKRVRFDAATTTAALRNICANIWWNDGETITVGTNLPAVPAAADVFYIEEPATALDQIRLAAAGNYVGTFGTRASISIVGIKAVTGSLPGLYMRGPARYEVAFIEIPSGQLDAREFHSVRATRFYTDENESSRLVGVGYRGAYLHADSGVNLDLSSFALVDSGDVSELLRINVVSVGGGSYSDHQLSIPESGNDQTSEGADLVVGGVGLTTLRRFRVPRLRIRGDVRVYGIQAENAGANPCIKVAGPAPRIFIDDVVGSTGNTDVGIDITAARDATIIAGAVAANTVAGTAGEVRLTDATGTAYLKTHADIAAMDEVDGNGNHVQGTGRSPFASRRPFLQRVAALTYGASVTPDVRNGNVFDLTLTGDATMQNPTGLTAYHDGLTLKFRIKQTAPGGAITWGNMYVGGSGIGAQTMPPTLSSPPLSDEILFSYHHASGKLRLLAVAPGYA